MSKLMKSNLEEIKQEAISAYLSNDNISVPVIARKFKLGITTLHRALRKNNIRIRTISELKTLTLPNNNIVQEYNRGKSILKLSKEFNISTSPIKRILKEKNIRIRTFYPTKRRYSIDINRNIYLNFRKFNV